MKLKQFLKDRIQQLKGRKNTIEAYLRNPKAFIGGSHLTELDLKIIDFEISETEAAIEAIEIFNLKVNKTCKQIN